MTKLRLWLLHKNEFLSFGDCKMKGKTRSPVDNSQRSDLHFAQFRCIFVVQTERPGGFPVFFVPKSTKLPQR